MVRFCADVTAAARRQPARDNFESMMTCTELLESDEKM